MAGRSRGGRRDNQGGPAGPWPVTPVFRPCGRQFAASLGMAAFKWRRQPADEAGTRFATLPTVPPA
jgi:hypothetical protein